MAAWLERALGTPTPRPVISGTLATVMWVEVFQRWEENVAAFPGIGCIFSAPGLYGPALGAPEAWPWPPPRPAPGSGGGEGEEEWLGGQRGRK